jgi:MFS family permease
MLFTVIIANNLILGGAWSVGIPVLADSRLPEGAAAFGTIWAAFAGGSLIGVILSGTIGRRIRASDAGLLTVAISGVGTLALAWAGDTWLACLLMFINGIGGGYINVVIVTLLHHRAPQTFLGRIMSLLYFSNIGLNPLSKALAGGIVKLSLGALLGGAGILLLLVAVWIPLQPAFRLMDLPFEQYPVTDAPGVEP